MSDIQPTPETDAEENKHGDGNAMHAHCHDSSHLSGDFADFARKLERERDSAKTLNRSLLDQLEAKDAQIEAMREAIGAAVEAFKFISSNWTSRDLEPGETIRQVFQAERIEEAKIALAKLQPFLKP